MDPTSTGFLAFVRSAGISSSALPDNSPYLPYAYNYAINVGYSGFAGMQNADPTQPSLYAVLIYNLATHTLVAMAQDVSQSTFFADLRKGFGLLSPFTGIISSASDEGTSASAIVPDWVQSMTLDELALVKTPWGRQYFMMAQKAAPPWGIS